MTQEEQSDKMIKKEIAIAPEEEGLVKGLVFGETYRLNRGRLVSILDLIEKKGPREFKLTYPTLLSNGIYIYGGMNLLLRGEGSKDGTGYIARIVDGAIISKKPSSLYLQLCDLKDGWAVNGTRPSLIRLLKEFIV
jgi:hypothetical protein